MENRLEHFRTHGFAVIENVIDEQAIVQAEISLSEANFAAHARRRSEAIYGVRNLLNAAPEIKRLAQHPRLRAIVEEFAGARARVVRAILFDKTPQANWKVAWHQDLTIAVQRQTEVAGFTAWSVKAGVPHVQPPVSVLENILTLRVHLDATDETNGALKVIADSHRHGRLNSADIENMKATGTVTVCRVGRGGILLMRPLLLHASSAGSRPAQRRVIHLEFSADELPGGLKWHTT